MKPFLPLMACLAFVAATGAQAQAPAAATSAPPALDSKQLSARYQSDLQICNSEATAAGRLQCKRDAKAEYDKALAEAKARRSASSTPASASLCAECGRVLSVTTAQREGDASAAGLIAGGLGGALLGRQIGGGTGRDLATLGGAAAGAYAGREIEKKMKTHTVWVVAVEFAGGQTARYEFAQDPGYRTGEIVRKSGHGLARP